MEPPISSIMHFQNFGENPKTYSQFPIPFRFNPSSTLFPTYQVKGLGLFRGDDLSPDKGTEGGVEVEEPLGRVLHLPGHKS